MDARTSAWAYASLLTGGLLILLGGLSRGLMMAAFPWMMDGTMGYGMMAGPWADGMAGWATQMAWWMGALGLVSGSLVLYAAHRLRRDASYATSAGTLAIVGGALSLLAMGGWIVGAALALVGGALCLGGEPTTGRPA